MRQMRYLAAAGLMIGGLATANWAANAAEPEAGAAEKRSGRIAYACKDGDRYVLHIMNADGTGDRVVPGIADQVAAFPTWSPDGKQLLFTGNAGAQDRFTVGRVNADGTGMKTLPTPTSRAGLAGWSRDGQQITFTAGDQEPHIYVADAEVNSARQISKPNAPGFSPVWLADGKSVVYTHVTGNNQGKLIRQSADGLEHQVLAEPAGGFAVAGPNALSPDGKKLLYTTHEPNSGKATLCVYDFEAKSDGVVMEFDTSGGQFTGMPCPGWSPDGKGYLVPIKTEKGTGLFLVSEDGAKRTRLTPEGADCTSGAWTGK